MSRNKGFTLIELLVVIAIIGILASIILVNLGNTRKQARDASAMASMSSIRSAAEVYYSTNGSYGTALSPAAACPTATGTTSVFNNEDVVKLTGAVGKQVTAPTCASVGTPASSWTVVTTLSDAATKYCVDSTGYAGKPTGSTIPATSGESCL